MLKQKSMEELHFIANNDNFDYDIRIEATKELLKRKEVKA